MAKDRWISESEIDAKGPGKSMWNARSETSLPWEENSIMKQKYLYHEGWQEEVNLKVQQKEDKHAHENGWIGTILIFLKQKKKNVQLLSITSNALTYSFPPKVG